MLRWIVDLTYECSDEGAYDADPILWENFAENFWSAQTNFFFAYFTVVYHHISDAHYGE